MANERYDSVWDAICDTPEEAERMKEWSRQEIEDKRDREIVRQVRQEIEVEGTVDLATVKQRITADRAVEAEALRRSKTPRSEYIKGDDVDAMLGDA